MLVRRGVELGSLPIPLASSAHSNRVPPVQHRKPMRGSECHGALCVTERGRSGGAVGSRTHPLESPLACRPHAQFKSYRQAQSDCTAMFSIVQTSRGASGANTTEEDVLDLVPNGLSLGYHGGNGGNSTSIFSGSGSGEGASRM